MTKLIVQTIITFIAGTVVLGGLLFLLAGTFNYWQAWVFVPVFMVSISGYGLYLSITDPAAMERRRQAGPGAEQSTLQKIVATLALAALAAVFVVAGLDRRFAWSAMPPALSIVGDAVEVLSFVTFTWVLRVNSFASANIQVEDKQPVISTGPYAVVRHPLYVGAMLMEIGIALGLGSWWGLLFFVAAMPVLVIRILDEEKTLEKDLAGYKEYEQKVRYRLVPYLW